MLASNGQLLSQINPPITNTAKRSTMPTGTGARRRSRRTVDNSTASESSSDDFRSVKIEDETVQQEVEPPTKKTRIDTSQSPRTLRKKKTLTANDVVGGSKSDVGQARLSSCKIPSALASSSKQPVSPNENEEASHQGEDNDGEASGSAPDDDTPKSHRASSKTGSGRGPPESRTCPYCKKVISTKVGLKYHIGETFFLLIWYLR